MTNPLLADFATPFDTAPFHLIKNEHFLPAINEAIHLAKDDIARIKSESLPTFENTIEALDRSGKKLGVISTIFFNLNSAETNDEIQKLAREISPLLTDHANDILLDQVLFQRVALIFEEKDTLNLSAEESTLLEK